MKKKDVFEQTLTHREILNFAILYLMPKLNEYDAQMKLCKDKPELLEVTKRLASPWFVKAKKLCELYELETGNEYELAAGCGLQISDLDID